MTNNENELYRINLSAFGELENNAACVCDCEVCGSEKFKVIVKKEAQGSSTSIIMMLECTSCNRKTFFTFIKGNTKHKKSNMRSVKVD